MPILAIGQSDFHNLSSNESNLKTNTGFQNHSILRNISDREKKIKTSLINDVKKDKTIIDFELNKSYNLSFNTKNNEKIKLFDDQKSDEVLFKLEPLKELNWQPIIPIKTKSLFKSLKSFELNNKS